MIANLANCLVINDGTTSVYYPNPGLPVFKVIFEAVVKDAKPVDVWNTHHIALGEIHCGTAAIRSLSPTPPWWEQTKVKEKWENER